jgi:DNA-directed RNA polymerase III subunit RPC8
MFILTRLTDTVKLLPSTEYSHAAVTQWLNAKYSNKVLHKIGLCIAVYDILSVGDGALKYGDGCVYIKSISFGKVV